MNLVLSLNLVRYSSLYVYSGIRSILHRETGVHIPQFIVKLVPSQKMQYRDFYKFTDKTHNI